MLCSVSQRQKLAQSKEGGFTLVELLVALALSLVISMAAVASLSVGRTGFDALDAAAQLRDNARFASYAIKRIALQSGFLDTTDASQSLAAPSTSGDDFPVVYGFNNSSLSASEFMAQQAWKPSEVGAGSDVLFLRQRSSNLNDAPITTDSPSDGANIDCSGAATAKAVDVVRSAFYVGPDTGGDGEPALLCQVQTADGIKTYVLAGGVESFKVIYGVDAQNPTAGTKFTSEQDGVPKVYLRADQITVGGDAKSADTGSNWSRVRSIRVGMVIRGAANSQPGATTQTFYPLGLGKSAPTAQPGSVFGDAENPGSIFTPPVDNRLRTVVTFTIHLRNILKS